MRVQVNLSKLTDAALTDVGNIVPSEGVINKPWLFGIKLRGGKTVALYPISSINPLAPPSFYVDSPECTEGVNNKELTSKIVREMSKHTKSKDLKDAVLMLKRAVDVISK